MRKDFADPAASVTIIPAAIAVPRRVPTIFSAASIAPRPPRHEVPPCSAIVPVISNDKTRLGEISKTSRTPRNACIVIFVGRSRILFGSTRDHARELCCALRAGFVVDHFEERIARLLRKIGKLEQDFFEEASSAAPLHGPRLYPAC